MRKQRQVYYVLESLVIIAAIALVAWMVKRPHTVKAATSQAEAAKTAVKPSEVKLPQVTAEAETDRALRDFQEYSMKTAGQKMEIAGLPSTPEENKRNLWREIVVLDRKYLAKMAPLLENPNYSDPKYEWISTGVTIALMRLRLVRDFLRSTEPPDGAK